MTQRRYFAPPGHTAQEVAVFRHIECFRTRSAKERVIASEDTRIRWVLFAIAAAAILGLGALFYSLAEPTDSLGKTLLACALGVPIFLIGVCLLPWNVCLILHNSPARMELNCRFFFVTYRRQQWPLDVRLVVSGLRHYQEEAEAKVGEAVSRTAANALLPGLGNFVSPKRYQQKIGFSIAIVDERNHATIHIVTAKRAEVLEEALAAFAAASPKRVVLSRWDWVTLDSSQQQMPAG